MDTLADPEGRPLRTPCGRPELHQRVELSLLPALDDTTAIIEWQQRGTRFNEAIAPSGSAARAWVEAHYEDVRWENEMRASGLIGMLAGELE